MERILAPAEKLLERDRFGPPARIVVDEDAEYLQRYAAQNKEDGAMIALQVVEKFFQHPCANQFSPGRHGFVHDR